MELNEIYQNAHERLKNTLHQIGEDEVTNPLLLKMGDVYREAKVRVMYFGQETNGWAGRAGFCESSVDLLMEQYHEWFIGERCWDYGYPFWRCMAKLHKKVDERLNGVGTIAYAWNNIIKVGKPGKGRPSGTALEWQKEWFGIVAKEVEILKPNVAIFFTGPNYDDFIREAFPDVEFSILNGSERSQRKFAKLKSDGLPRIALRTYHPGYLQRQGLDVLEAYLNEIVGALNIDLID